MKDGFTLKEEAEYELRKAIKNCDIKSGEACPFEDKAKGRCPNLIIRATNPGFDYYVERFYNCRRNN